MTTVDVRTPAGDTAGSVELPEEIFNVQVNVPLIHQVVVGQLAAARQGTHSTKTRGDVRGGGKKPYRQKGTGRARQGSTRAPQFTGGGVVHGPHPRDYSQRTPKKMKAAALRGALSDRARGGRIHVVTSLVDGSTPSTKVASALLAAISDRPHVLVVVERSDSLTWKSLRNVVNVHLLVPDQLNTYDVLVSDDIVFTRGALAAFLAGPTRGKGAKSVAGESDLDDAEVADLIEVEVEKPAKPAKKAAAKAAPAADAVVETKPTETETEAEPEAKAPAKKAPAKKAAAKVAAPETSAPESSAPESSAPETSAPESSAPESSAPETTEPETDEGTQA
jgi:large subunit ribosomal protein L4